MGQFRYEGAWHRGQKHGLGVLYLGDGSTIEATFMDGEISGQGLRRWPDGRTYTGNFHNGELHGEGTMVTSDGSTYSGEYRNNRRHGAGELRETKTGGVYQGEFENHLRHGEGTQYDADGNAYTGMWSQGLRHGTGSMEFADGSGYSGEWKKGLPCGNGLLKEKSCGYAYEGSFNSGVAREAACAFSAKLPFNKDKNAYEASTASGDTVEDWKLVLMAKPPASSKSKSKSKRKVAAKKEVGRTVSLMAFAAQDDAAEGANEFDALDPNRKPVHGFFTKSDATSSADEEAADGSGGAADVEAEDGSVEETTKQDFITCNVENGIVDLAGVAITAAAGAYDVLVQDATGISGTVRDYLPALPPIHIILTVEGGAGGKSKGKK
eukprot:g415.t1